MTRDEVAEMMNAWVARKGKEHGDAYVVGYFQSLLETLAGRDTLVLAELIKHFGDEEE